MELNYQQKVINFILTFIQYVGFILFLIISPMWAGGLFWQIIEVMGFALAAWAIITMRQSKFNIAPQPLKKAKLVKSGPYKWIRHPMYASLIIAVTPLIITHWDLYRFLFLLFLYVNLLLKLLFEESLLLGYFDEYPDYKNTTWRLIPYIY